MRFVAVDWGTSRFRAHLVEGGTVLARAEAEGGVSRLKEGEHRGVFWSACGPWLAAEPGLPVVMAGMVGSREGWVQVPYVDCPAGPAEIARGLTRVDLGEGCIGAIVPGLRSAAGEAVDVMRGEETHLLGSGVTDGLVCLPGTHCKWALMDGGRIAAFATFLTGELYALLREHSMVGRPATEPADPGGFGRGLEAARREAERPGGGLLHLLFGARAATVTGRLAPAALGPYLSGLLTGHEIAGAIRLFGRPDRVTIVADPPRADLYRQALGREGIRVRIVGQEETLLAGLAAILERH